MGTIPAGSFTERKDKASRDSSCYCTAQLFLYDMPCSVLWFYYSVVLYSVVQEPTIWRAERLRGAGNIQHIHSPGPCIFGWYEFQTSTSFLKRRRLTCSQHDACSLQAPFMAHTHCEVSHRTLAQHWRKETSFLQIKF